jgi:hypothetical protein
MMTQTHVLVAAALLARRDQPGRNWAIAAGALLPDAAMFVFFGQGLLQETPQSQLWNEAYWQPGWQAVFAIFNSVPLYAVLLVISLALSRNLPGAAFAVAFSLAALLHLAADFPVHAEDAHAHFWPISTWRFHSPVSYWDHDHHGAWVGLAESAMGLTCAWLVGRRFRQRWVLVLSALVSLPYLLSPLLLFRDLSLPA